MSADQSLPARSRPGPLPIGVSLRAGLGAFDEAFSCGAAGERSFLFARPPVSGELGAAFVASPVERVPIAREELAAGDEVAAVLVAGEREPCGAAVSGVPEPGPGGFGAAVGGALASIRRTAVWVILI